MFSRIIIVAVTKDNSVTMKPEHPTSLFNDISEKAK
jgi:hypothetical protein